MTQPQKGIQTTQTSSASNPLTVEYSREVSPSGPRALGPVLRTADGGPVTTQSGGECRTRLLLDTVSSVDEFGAHTRVARAIADVILEESDGKAANRGAVSIGLSGRWGAGKSTVVALVKHQLERHSNCKVWVFDAWAHEGDPLRRTFLESLIVDLKGSWVDEKKWSLRLRLLSRRLKKTDTRSTPTLLEIGKLYAVGALLVPIGLALIGEALREFVLLPPGQHAPDYLLWGGLMAMAPLLVLGSSIVRNWIRAALARRGSRPVIGGSSPFQIFTNKGQTKVRSRSFESPEPTSIEFENDFTDLMHDVFDGNDRRLVLVVDNLDRIDPEVSAQIWSTLQTFLQRGRRREPWLDRLRIIMPYDPQGIERIWPRGGGSQQVNPSVSGGSVLDQFGSGAGGSILDKIFQVRFDVPSPLRSDWRKYLYALLVEALPDHEKDFHVIYTVISRFGLGTPTPRELKLIVNQIGALHRQWNHEIPIVQLAYFALLTRQGQMDPALIRSGVVAKESDSGFLGADVRRNLAALAFGAEPDRALQLLLEPVLFDAFKQGDAEAIERFLETPGFIEIVENSVPTIAEIWPTQQGDELLTAIATLDKAGVFTKLEHLRSFALLSRACEGLRKIKSFSERNATVEDDILRIVRLHGDDKETIDRLVQAYRLRPFNQSNTPTIPESARKAVGFAAALASSGHMGLSETGLEFDGDLDGFLAAFEAVKNEEAPGSLSVPFLFVLPRRDSKSFVELFMELVTTHRCRMAYVELFVAIRNRDHTSDWSRLATAVGERLNAAQGESSREESEALLALIAQLRETEMGWRTISNLASGGHIAHRLAMLKSPVAQARAIDLMLDHDPGLTTRATIGSAGQGYEILDKILETRTPGPIATALARLLVVSGRQARIPALLETNPNAKSFVAAIATCLVEDEALALGRDVINASFLTKHWQIFEDQPALSAAITLANRTGGVSRHLVEGGFTTEKSSWYLRCLEAQPADQVLLEFLARGLQSLDSRTWLTELRGGGDTLKLLMAYRRDHIGFHLGAAFRDSVTEHGEALAAATEPAPPHAAEWHAILESLAIDERSLTAGKLWSQIEERKESTAPVFFDVYGPTISAWVSLPPNAMVAIHDLFLKRCVPGLAWLTSFAATKGRELASLPNYTVLARDIATELRDGREDAAHTHVVAIAEAMSISAAEAPSVR
jgi:hypothetical protein